MLSDGRVVGTHGGHARFTIGQRRGLPGGFAEPMYVVDIRPADRAVIVGTRDELLGHGVIAREMNWLVDAPVVGTQVEVQIRHRSVPAPAEIIRIDHDEIELALQQPVAAIAPGIFLVIYDGDRVLGGGIIEASRRARTGLPVLAA